MDIHQVSVDYQHEQDRILVRINTRQDQEIRLWLTRRLCSGWVPVLRQSVTQMGEPPANATPVALAAQDTSLASGPEAADFKTPFKDGPTQWPLGSEPLLITTVRMTPQAEHRLELAFEESLSGHESQARGFQVALEPRLLGGFMHLLDQALALSEWLSPGVESYQAQEPEDSHPTKPKYLH